MPQYHNCKKHEDLGEIKITPHPFWRRIWPLSNYAPYFVGDRVWFRLQIDTPIPQYVIYEIFNGNDLHRGLKLVPDKLIVGDVINKEGDVEYRIAVSGYPNAGITIFTAHAINTDRFALGCIGVISGAIVAIASGIILGFIKIDPAWHIWNPFR